MGTKITSLIPTSLFDGIQSSLRMLLVQILSHGAMPRHVAFIPDGNRRYGRKHRLPEGEAHSLGMMNLLYVLKYCYEMNIQYVSLYGFSIDNFKRKPNEVQVLMELIRDKSEAIAANGCIASELGIRVEFLGSLDLLDEPTRESVRQVMAVTASNSRMVLLICLAYTSTDEIVHGVKGSCLERRARGGECESISISVGDLERNMYYAGHPDPDILIRTSGETRLSNFLLWQTKGCLLYSPRCLWPEVSLHHLVWAVLLFQRNWGYLDRIKKKMSQ